MVQRRGTTPHESDRPVDVALSVFGLCGFALAQPLFAVLGRGATFFAAHRVDRWELLVFVAIAIFMPPAVVFLPMLIARYAHAPVWQAVVNTVMGVLSALVLVPPIDRALHLSTLGFMLLLALVALGAALVYARSRVARMYTRATAFAPALFAVVFLFGSQVSGIVRPHDGGDAAITSRPTNVMLVVFDELPLGALVDEAGRINAARFPNFARLAARSTWYRNTSTVANWTDRAVPAILAGVLPPDDAIPTASEYPRNLFRMLESTHDIHAFETVTYLCAYRACADAARPSATSLYRDASIVYLHSLLPDDLASDLLPNITFSWGDFAWASVRRDQRERFEQFMDSVRDSSRGRPALWYSHVSLPHLPARYLPDGRRYELGFHASPGVEDDGLTWTNEVNTVMSVQQRFLLQVKFVDRLVGELLDTIESEEIGTNTLLIVTADHGVSFRPGESRRGVPLTEENRNDLLAVPLFVAYPDKARASIDDAPRETTDILPTIAEQLDAGLPEEWRFDGRPLSDHAGRSRRDFVHDVQDNVPLRLDLAEAAAPYLMRFGEGRARHDVYAWGPHRGLVGTPTATAAGAARPTARLLSPDRLRYDPTSAFVPALVHLELGEEAPGAEWVAVAANDVVAGLAPISREGGTHHARVMVDPSLLDAGDNELTAYLVGDGDTLTRIPMLA